MKKLLVLFLLCSATATFAQQTETQTHKLPSSIQMVSMLDYKTGRRYLHNLDKIVVSIAE